MDPTYCRELWKGFIDLPLNVELLDSGDGFWVNFRSLCSRDLSCSTSTFQSYLDETALTSFSRTQLVLATTPKPTVRRSPFFPFRNANESLLISLQSLAAGRLRHFAEITSPLTLFASSNDLKNAQKLLQEYQEGVGAGRKAWGHEESAGVWKAKQRESRSCCHRKTLTNQDVFAIQSSIPLCIPVRNFPFLRQCILEVLTDSL